MALKQRKDPRSRVERRRMHRGEYADLIAYSGCLLAIVACIVTAAAIVTAVKQWWGIFPALLAGFVVAYVGLHFSLWFADWVEGE